MKLFDIIAGKVVIHPDALGIPCFKEVWDSNQDKDLMTKYITYVVLKNKFDSPYVQSYNPEDIEPLIKQELFKDSLYELPEVVKECEKKYLRLMDSLTLRLLRNARNKLDSISKYYEESLGDDLDEKRVKDILQGMASLGKTIQSLDELTINVKNEEMAMSKVRGGGKIGEFEVPIR